MQRIFKAGLGLFVVLACVYGLWLTLDSSGAKAFAANMTLGVARGLPQTGADPTTYADYDEVSGEDGYPKNWGWSGTHFTDNGDFTITDNATGLMWAQDPINDIGGAFASGMAWSDAITNCNDLTFAGYSDWRLPNVKELQSIVNYGRANPSIGETTASQSPWENTQSARYWSSTTHADSTTSAWLVVFYYGVVTNNLKTTATYYVRPVRAGQ